MITVKHYMIDAGWRNADLAQALGVTESYVSLVLNGKRRMTVERLRKLAQVTGASMETLAAEMGRKPKRKSVRRANGT